MSRSSRAGLGRAMRRPFARDDSGMSAVEFALILPVMVALYFGAVELANALIADRKTTAVAATVADLATQAPALGDDDIDDIFAAATAIMAPFDAGGMEIVLTSASDRGGGSIRVDWSDALNATPRGEDTAVAVPDDIVMPGGSVVIAEVRFNFVSGVGRFLTGGIDLNDVFYARPRRSLVVARLD